MNSSKETIVDFVVRGSSQGEWRLVLVEEGPWETPVEDHLRRLQARLYGCLDAVIEGHFAEQFPESVGRPIVLQIDCYQVPKIEVESFFRRFASGVLETDEYRLALEQSAYVTSIEFAANFVRTG